jgi:hypothetical protein
MEGEKAQEGSAVEPGAAGRSRSSGPSRPISPAVSSTRRERNCEVLRRAHLMRHHRHLETGQRGERARQQLGKQHLIFDDNTAHGIRRSMS